jgi:hypothetical protein
MKSKKSIANPAVGKIDYNRTLTGRNADEVARERLERSKDSIPMTFTEYVELMRKKHENDNAKA